MERKKTIGGKMNEITQAPIDADGAAAFLKLKKATVYNLVFYGKLKAYKPGGKKLLFKLPDLEKYSYGSVIGGHSEWAETILNVAQKKKPRRKVMA
ncbi:MAG: excisionase family DNA-binding protein [Treponema sp.]|nr:excisionase family DNA-binding protein [Treponema sp.]